jgi:hypothetical protein
VRGAVSSRRTALIALADATRKERFPIQRICQTLISSNVFVQRCSRQRKGRVGLAGFVFTISFRLFRSKSGDDLAEAKV